MTASLSFFERAMACRLESGVVASNEFRDFAYQCLDWARTTTSDNERDIFLQMARSWLEVAERSDAGPTAVDRARQEVVSRLAQTVIPH
jgi:hypothetical protein